MAAGRWGDLLGPGTEALKIEERDLGRFAGGLEEKPAYRQVLQSRGDWPSATLKLPDDVPIAAHGSRGPSETTLVEIVGEGNGCRA